MLSKEQNERLTRVEDPTVATVRDPAKNTLITFASATRPWLAGEEHVYLS